MDTERCNQLTFQKRDIIMKLLKSVVKDCRFIFQC